MDCLACELKRARCRAWALLLLRLSLERIASDLSRTYGARYYVEDSEVFRASTLHPFTPVSILRTKPNVKAN